MAWSIQIPQDSWDNISVILKSCSSNFMPSTLHCTGDFDSKTLHCGRRFWFQNSSLHRGLWFQNFPCPPGNKKPKHPRSIRLEKSVTSPGDSFQGFLADLILPDNTRNAEPAENWHWHNSFLLKLFQNLPRGVVSVAALRGLLGVLQRFLERGQCWQIRP